MANDITGNPWKLDTAAAIKTTPTRVLTMEWTPTTDGDDLLVSDNSGHEIWSLKALAGDASEQIPYTWPGPEGYSCNGFTLTTIDNGTLRVWVA